LRLGQAMLNEQAEQAGRQDRREDQNADEYDRHEVMGSSARASERALAVSGLASHRGADLRTSAVLRRLLETLFEVSASLEGEGSPIPQIMAGSRHAADFWANTAGTARFQEIIQLH
jgi:hypothetical protein